MVVVLVLMRYQPRDAANVVDDVFHWVVLGQDPPRVRGFAHEIGNEDHNLHGTHQMWGQGKEELEDERCKKYITENDKQC